MSSLAENISIKTSHYIIGAIGLVAALSWKEAIREAFTKYFPSEGNLLALFINAFLTTLILIIMINILPDTDRELPKKTQKAIEREKQKKKIEALEMNIKKLNNRIIPLNFSK